MKSPYFSVIIPTYNRSARLSAAISSVIAQTFQDWELIIVDDGSTDDTSSVVRMFNDNRIRYIHQENRERSAARNHGLDLSRGEYICFLDSDDRYTPDHLAYIHASIRQRGGSLLRVYTIFESEASGEQTLQPIPESTSLLHRDAETHFVNIVCNPSALCVKREFTDKVRFDESMNLGEDFDFIIRLLKLVPEFVPVPEHTVIMVEHDGSSQNQRSPEFHQKYIEAIKSLLYRRLISGEENMRTLMERIAMRYRWMAECHRMNGNLILYWYYRVFSRLSK